MRNLSTHTLSSSLERVAAFPRLDSISPDGSVMNWHPGNSSPVSCIRQRVSSHNSSADPLNEYGTDDPRNFKKGKGKLTLEETAEMELSSSIDYGL